MLWFVSLVFTDFHKYFIVHGVLFCFVFCLVVRDCIVDASFDHNYLLLFVFFSMNASKNENCQNLSLYRCRKCLFYVYTVIELLNI